MDLFVENTEILQYRAERSLGGARCPVKRLDCDAYPHFGERGQINRFRADFGNNLAICGTIQCGTEAVGPGNHFGVFCNGLL